MGNSVPRVLPIPVGRLLVGPGQEALALVGKKRFQLIGAGFAGQPGFLTAGNLQVHQRQRDMRKAPFGTEQRAVHFHLRPVQRPLVIRHARQATAMGLDLFDTVARHIETIGAARHAQPLILSGERQFGEITGDLFPPPGHQSVPLDALLSTGCGRKAVVQVALAGGEVTQGTHRHAIAAHGWGCQRTWQTSTGIPWRQKKSIQRRWLSCRRSPGPLTSIIR